jgi:ATP-dependent Clp protease ATP-binding subunit ClpC
LLDEIEKAHPDVFNVLLQLMDEGRLTDGSGRTVNFKNTVIIMTSNIGTRQLKDFGRGVGFAAQNRGAGDAEYSRSVIQKALNKTFAPEFLNRIDEIITFDQLSPEAIGQIVDIELKGLLERVEGLGYHLTVDDSAKKFLASKGYDVQFGARPLKRAIQSYLEDALSELIVNSSLSEGDSIVATLNEEKQALNVQKA